MSEMWPQILIAILVGALLVVAIGLVLNVNKLLSRVASIRRHLQEADDSGPGAQLTEAVAQLQSVAVSLDRIAERCEGMDGKLAEIVARGPGGGGLGPEATAALGEVVSELQRPLHEIRDMLGRTKTERLSDDIKRTLHNMGYDRVTVKTDLATIGPDEEKVQVEVAREGVVSKGYVVVRDGGVVDQKISKPYEMFP